MTPPSDARCLSCERTDQDVPLMTWRYQGRELWICPDCLPRLIHRRAELADQLEPNAAPPPQP